MAKVIIADINVKNVDVGLLRRQRNALLKIKGADVRQRNALTGIITMLDNMLDIAEGYAQ